MRERNNGRRVVVTGLGAVTALGTGVEKTFSALKRGECAIGPITAFERQDLYIFIAAEVKDFDPRQVLTSKMLLAADRYSQFAAAAAAEALAQSGLPRPLLKGDRAACIVGSGVGGLASLERGYEELYVHKKKATHPFTLLRTIGSSAAAHISIEHKIKGPVFGTVSACATASHAIGLAMGLIRAGAADIAVAGASEAAITFGSLRAWQAMRVLSPDGCFPFSKRRNGTTLGEGAGVLVLEELEHAKARGAHILCEAMGFGMTSDAMDMVNPDVEGPAAAMRLALADAGLSPSDITYLNAHGTATHANDINETRAIKAVFGNHTRELSISSTKSAHGHCLGAGGGVEAVISIKAMEEGFVPATLGFDEPGEECDLDYTPNEGKARAITYAMSNSFAFGGLNAVLVFGPAPG